MMFVLLDQLARIGQGGPHVGFCHPVLGRHLVDAQPARQAPQEPHDPGPAVPRMTGFPWCTAASMTMRSFIAAPFQAPASLGQIPFHRTQEMPESQSRELPFKRTGRSDRVGPSL